MSAILKRLCHIFTKKSMPEDKAVERSSKEMRCEPRDIGSKLPEGTKSERKLQTAALSPHRVSPAVKSSNGNFRANQKGTAGHSTVSKAFVRGIPKKPEPFKEADSDKNE